MCQVGSLDLPVLFLKRRGHHTWFSIYLQSKRMDSSPLSGLRCIKSGGHNTYVSEQLWMVHLLVKLMGSDFFLKKCLEENLYCPSFPSCSTWNLQKNTVFRFCLPLIVFVFLIALCRKKLVYPLLDCSIFLLWTLITLYDLCFRYMGIIMSFLLLLFDHPVVISTVHALRNQRNEIFNFPFFLNGTEKSSSSYPFDETCLLKSYYLYPLYFINLLMVKRWC